MALRFVLDPSTVVNGAIRLRLNALSMEEVIYPLTLISFAVRVCMGKLAILIALNILTLVIQTVITHLLASCIEFVVQCEIADEQLLSIH